MKHFYLVLFILAFLSAKTQNWQAVYSDRLVYFDSSRQAIKIVSVSIDNSGDSTFKNYPQYFIDTLGNDITRMLAIGGRLSDSSSWIGKKIIIKPNGYNGFCSDRDDWFWLDTRAVLNDTFVFHEDSNTLIKAYCKQVFVADTFNVKDSVKSYGFIFTVKPGYNHQFDTASLKNFEVILSKHHGFLKAPVFNKIYLTKGIYTPGSTFCYSNKNYFTNYNFNNLEIGDEYEYIVSDLPVFGIVKDEIRNYYQVIDKKQIASTDTFQYDFLVKSRLLTRDMFDTKRWWVYYWVGNEQQKRVQNSDAYKGLLPGQLVDGVSPSSFYFTDICNLLISINRYGFESSGSDNYHSKIGWLQRYVDGSVYGGNVPVGKEYSISYENFCNAQSGTPWAKYYVYGVGINEVNGNEIKLYPNPANSTVSISTPNIIAISLTDISGKKIDFSYTTSNNISTFDISVLPAGVYFCEVETEKGKTTHKLLVQH